MKNFSIIVAIDKEDGIWKNNDLPWKIPSDLKNFKKITSNSEQWKQNAVIMWRKTWESIPKIFKPLIWRRNFILTTQKNFFKDTEVFSGFDLCLKNISKDETIDKVFVIWWWEIYNLAINHKNCEKIFLTRILWVFNCDKFFPKIPGNFIKNIKNKNKIIEDNWINFIFEDFYRII